MITFLPSSDWYLFCVHVSCYYHTVVTSTWMLAPLTNEVRKTSNEYHVVADNLWTLNVKNLRGFVAKDCEIQSWIEAEYLFRK